MAEDTTLEQAQLAQLRAALASGALVVQFADRRIEYRSVDELLKGIRDIEGVIAKKSGRRLYKQIRCRTSKGY